MSSEIPVDIPTLKNIASFNVAITLWNENHVSEALARFRGNRKRNQVNKEWFSLYWKIRERCNGLLVPKSVLDEVNKYIKRISIATVEWIAYHFRTIFFENDKKYFMYRHFHHIVWYPDGTIDCKRTASSMLKSHRLSDVEKYRFLCTYCLKNEIERMPSSIFMNNVIDDANFSTHPLIYYWNCYFRNELLKVPVPENESMDSFMFQHSFVDNWPAKEYFFDCMSSDEQVRQTIRLIDGNNDDMYRYQRLILMKLEESKRIYVYKKRIVKIIENYTSNFTNPELIISTWYDVRDLITEDQFVMIFNNLLKSQICNTVLTEIWVNARDDFTHHLLNHDDQTVIEKIFSLSRMTNDSSLIFTFLSDVNANVRKAITEKRFFVDYCEILLTKEKSSTLFHLLNLCIPEFKEMLQFKIKLIFKSTAIKKQCLKYLSSGKWKIVDELLTLLLSPNPNQDSILEYKKDLLISPEGLDNCAKLIDSPTINVLNDIIENCFTSVVLKTEIKKKLIFSTPAIYNLRYMILTNRLDDVKKCVDLYLSSNEDKIIMKKRLMNNPAQLVRVIFLRYDDTLLRSLLEWCYDADTKETGEFKSSLPGIRIVDDIFQDCISKNDFKLSSLDQFFVWYFKSRSKRKAFEQEHVETFKRIAEYRNRQKRQKLCD